MSEDFPALAGFRAGSLLAGYRLEEQVGAGGFAVVFRARDQRLGQRAYFCRNSKGHEQWPNIHLPQWRSERF